MSEPHPWRRLSDWKTEVFLFDLGTLGPKKMARLGLFDAVAELRAHAPVVGTTLARLRHVRVGEALEASLHEAGLATWEVGYHRGVEHLWLRKRGPGGREAENFDVGAIACEMFRDPDWTSDDAPPDRVPETADALLQVKSARRLSEAAVLLAAELPVLEPRGAGAWRDPALGALDVASLPKVDETWLFEVEGAEQRVRVRVVNTGPELSPEQRRRYQRQALWILGGGLLLAAISVVTTPMLMVLAGPLLALGPIIYLLHAVALRVESQED